MRPHDAANVELPARRRHRDGYMATAVTAYKQAFGFDAPPYTYADFELGVAASDRNSLP